MIRQKHVDHYISLYEAGKVKFNEERRLLVEYLRRDILPRDDLSFDDGLIDKCIAFGEKWYFPLEPFQRFLIAFISPTCLVNWPWCRQERAYIRYYSLFDKRTTWYSGLQHHRGGQF